MRTFPLLQTEVVSALPVLFHSYSGCTSSQLGIRKYCCLYVNLSSEHARCMLDMVGSDSPGESGSLVTLASFDTSKSHANHHVGRSKSILLGLLGNRQRISV